MTLIVSMTSTQNVIVKMEHVMLLTNRDRMNVLTTVTVTMISTPNVMIMFV